MDTKDILEVTLIKCAVAFNPKDINAWMDTKTHGQIAEDLTNRLFKDGYCLQKIDRSYIINEVEIESNLTTEDGE